MSLTTKLLAFTLILFGFGASLKGQNLCSEEDPFTLSPSRTFCVDSSGIAEISFNIFHRGGVGDYVVTFPDGTDTIFPNITADFKVSRDLLFDCARPPGSPRPPSEFNRFYEYGNDLTVVRTDCVDEQGDPKRSAFNFNVLPNPVREIEISNLVCRTSPYIVDVSAVLCSEELVSDYQWYFNDEIIPGANEATIEGYTIDKPGDHEFRIDVTTYNKDCETFTTKRPITITAAPTLEVEYSLDDSQLCSPQFEVTTNTKATNITSFLWTSPSPDVTFSNDTIANPIITINNENPGSHLIKVTGNNTDCGAVTRQFTIDSYSGQQINQDGPLKVCARIPLDLCDAISYSTQPVSIAWSTTADGVTIDNENGSCPVVTFGSEGNYQLLASGTDVCGLPFSLPVSISVRNSDPIVIDTTVIGTVCETATAVELLDFISPRGNVSSITGSGVSGTTFNPAGLSGEVTLVITDKCGVEYPFTIFVTAEGAFSGGDPTVCQGSTLDLNGIQPGDYSGTGVTDNVFNSTGLLPGPYTIAFTSTAFCGGNGSFTITVEEPSMAGFSITPTDLCEEVDSLNAGNIFRVNTPLELVNTSTASVRSYQVVERGDSIGDVESTTLTFDIPGIYTLRQIVGPSDGVCRDTTDTEIEVIAPLDILVSVAVDSSSCDSLGLQFTTSGSKDDVEYFWAFSNGDSSSQASPKLDIIRPLSAEVFRATVGVSDGCYLQRDTFYINLPRRFQVAFGVLNDNNTLCSGETAFLVNNSVNASGFVFTFPDGTTSDRLPDSLVLINNTSETLIYPISLSGSNADCPDQLLLDTIFVLPVSTEAAFTLTYGDNCTPAEVNLTSLATPGAISFVDWGDGSTIQPIAEGQTLVYAYATDRDTTYNITMVSTLCGVDSFTRPFSVRAGADAGFNISPPDASCAGLSLQFIPDTLFSGGSAKWLFGDGDSSLLNRPEHAYQTSGTYMVSLEVINANGCAARSTDTIVINEYTGLPLQANIPNTICVDAPFFVGTNGTGTGLTYDYGNQVRVTEPIERPYREEGEYAFTLTATDLNGCRIDTSVIVEVFPRFSVEIQPEDPELTVEFGDPLQLSFRMDPLRLIDSIIWLGDSLDSPNTQRTVAYPLSDGIYTLGVTDEYGCLATDSLRVNVGRNYDNLIYAPNAFSPNGDGTNETFGIDAKPNTVRSLSALRVFSRWGETLYSCTDCSLGSAGNGWNGELGGKPMNSGVYVWTAEIEFLDGHRQVFRGTVAIVR